MKKHLRYNFTIYGEPMGKGRHRTTSTGHQYTPQKTVNYENLVKHSFIESVKGKNKLLEGPLYLEIDAYFKIPKSTSQKKKESMKQGILRPTKKPDIDNIQKIVGDALNNLAYHDDKQIVDARQRKFYGEVPRVEVRVWEVEI
ncbi:MAG: RusA family crossover junction endodeoxyribonuclease [Clostridiaceae bacterium]|nr:RusA family crossover junction endodeoxyribonuclease [Clostridiaceae bacterium]